MEKKHAVLMVLAGFGLFAMLAFIFLGENGLADYFSLRSERDRLMQENQRLTRENIDLYRTIDRLKNDPAYVESVARKELGMIGKDEVILKSRPAPQQTPPKP